MNANGKTGLSGLTSRRCACIRVMLAFACMVCAQDWTAVFPAGVNKLQCPKCNAIAGEPVQIHNRDWFMRFVRGGVNQQQQMLVCLNANRMENP